MLSREAWRRLGSIVLIPALLAVALLTWALASPLGSSPDEDYHLNSIWCGLGDRAGLCEPGPTAKYRDTPQALSGIACFAGNADTTANCQHLDNHALGPTERVNVQHSYPPLFYAAMGVFASSHYVASVLVMRLVNVLIFTALGLALYALLPPPRRPVLVLSWAVTLVPLSAFLIASVNPSSWTIMGCGTAWLAALGFFETTGRRRAWLGGLALLGTVMAAGSRADGAAYSILGVAIACVIGLAHAREFWRPRTLWLPAAVVVLGGAGVLSARQSGAAITGVTSAVTPTATATAAATAGATAVPSPVPTVATTALGLPQGGTAQGGGFGLLFHNLLNVPWLWTGPLGEAPLGWLDTAMPSLVPAFGVFSFAAVVFVALRVLDWRKAASLIVIVGAMVLIPLYTLQRSDQTVGTNLQPRYLIPLMFLLAGVALLSVGERVVRFTRTQLIVLVVLLAAGNCAALHANITRYAQASQSGGFDLNHFVAWWWGGGMPSPMVVWLVGSAAGAAVLALTVLRVGRTASER